MFEHLGWRERDDIIKGVEQTIGEKKVHTTLPVDGWSNRSEMF
ncbi:MAG: hypothetical protein Ct9H90mP5_03000 [Acidimicrobiaceae bacterium]|nr:MAG: hypothetical protein Ct9H90mP5_03000 [Acidimicrobiaceae bacterium]